MEKKVQNAWAFYDWANSVYSLVISTAVFPLYYGLMTSIDGNPIDVEFLGTTIKSNAIFPYSISLSFIIVAIISPFLSGIADYMGNKRKFLAFFCYLGSFACIALFFFGKDNIFFGLGMSILASIGFWGSIVFYNAFLPEVAPPEKQDKLSAKGFSLGYIGSSILLIAILAMVLSPDTFGFGGEIPEASAMRFGFILVGIWWLGFAQFTLRRLPNNPYNKVPGEKYIWNGFQEIRRVWFELKDQNQTSLRRFLYSFFFYSMGVQTVILLAALYAEFLGIETTDTITTILIIQFVGIGGAYLFAFFARKYGNFTSLKISIIIWTLICGIAYTLTKEDPDVNLKFYGLGGLVGLVLGGIQSVSRSTYSKMLKEDTESHASYFSFYDVAEKVAVVFGTITFGLLTQIYDGNMKASALSLMIFFAIGFLLMLRVKKTKHVH